MDFGAPIVQTVHSCVTSWWSAVKQEPLPPLWSYYRQHVTASLQGSDYLTVPSHSALRDTARHYHVDMARSAVIYNGLNQSIFTPAAKEPLILSAGRLWDEAKNISLLAALASELEWPVVLAGSGAVSGAESCRLLGELGRAELRNWQAKASIYASPAKYEPFGLSVLEAALSGCALVLSDIPSFREIWGDSAIFIHPDDSAGLLTALRRLIRDESYREAMAHRASHRARRYSLARMTEGYLSLYSRVRHRSMEKHLCAS
jgi:glycosyltransferase involved in cell wall biosynthesis